MALAAVSLAAALAPATTGRAAVGTWSSGGPGERIHALSVNPQSDQQITAAGETGVWRTTDGGGSWARVADTALRRALAVAPDAPDTFYSIDATGKNILRSADGGGSWQPAYTGGGSTQVYSVVADPHTPGLLYAGVTAADGLAQLLRSADGGASWKEMLPADRRGAGGIGQTAVTTVAALPGVPGLVFAGEQTYHGGLILKSVDSGATWNAVYGGGLTPLQSPYGLAAAGTSQATATVYAYFTVTGVASLIRSDDAGATWTDLTPALPLPRENASLGLLTNPVQPAWLYLAAASSPRGGDPRAGVFASADRGQTWEQVGQPGIRVNGVAGLALAVPSRTLVAASDAGVQQATIAWPVLPHFAPYYDAHDGYRLLGTAISLRAEEGGRTVQYFEKGRLEDHAGESPDPNWAFMYGLLVDDLQAAAGAPGADLPIGGDVSALTYRQLHGLAEPSRRVPLPAGYGGAGVMPVGPDGAVFVPFTAALGGAPGHVVLPLFWSYINRTDLFPGGWLHDVGLPISEAAYSVQVTKLLPDGPAQRSIVVQAFQRAILTYDPENPADWQVERANTGSDFRKTFPERVGP